MKIYLTFDYELYFGSKSGTAEYCLLRPTELIRNATDPYNVKTTQFVDAGYLLRCRELSASHPELLDDFATVTEQLRKLSLNGHELQLHIHPHWFDTEFINGAWKMNTTRYRLHDFDATEIESIVRSHSAFIRSISNNRITTFRAGGWCIQPFIQLKKALQEEGIYIDSSIFSGGHYTSDQYFYDFRNSPQKSQWSFEDDPLQPVEKGSFTEVPITSIRNSPLFYWKLFLLGRLFPGYHKPIGNGRPMAAPGQRKKLLTNYTLQTVSLDGYNASLLSKALRQQEKKKAESMVIIGHPKSLTPYGADALEKFVRDNHQRHEFSTFNRLRTS
jgi:hypothetical protein